MYKLELYFTPSRPVALASAHLKESLLPRVTAVALSQLMELWLVWSVTDLGVTIVK